MDQLCFEGKAVPSKEEGGKVSLPLEPGSVARGGDDAEAQAFEGKAVSFRLGPKIR